MTTSHDTPPPTSHDWWRPHKPSLGFGVEEPFPAQDTEILSLGTHDRGLLVELRGRLWPADALQTPQQRSEALSRGLPPGSVVLFESALWVHLGGSPPEHVEVSHALRISPPHGVTLRRMDLPTHAIVRVGQRPVQSLVRAVADIARLRSPHRAYRALWVGFAHGVTPLMLGVDLEMRRGQAAIGRPQARELITQVWTEYEASAGRVEQI